MTRNAVRSTAVERRVEVISAALSEFAIGGLHGTSTEAIARRAGISHAYLFRLFGTKQKLFIACAERCFDRTLDTFVAAAVGATAKERLESMGHAYIDMLADRELLLGQMQLYVACTDPEIRDVARIGYGRLREAVARLSGAPPDELYKFFATGMLINVAACMDSPELANPACW
jgi:AcrR family transcriptional regulator